MKLSFKQSTSKQTTTKSKPSSQQHEPSEKPEFLTEFDSSKTLISDQKSPIIIPPKQNEWRPTKKMKNLDLPPLHSNGKPLEFEIEDSEFKKPEPGNDISYGLNVRQQQQKSKDSSSIDAIMVKKLRNDLDMLGDDEGFDSYDEVPVESFAEALMAGYGWKKGMGIGRNAKEDAKVVEYKRWSAKEGIGFTMDDDMTKSKEKEKGLTFDGSKSKGREKDESFDGSKSKEREKEENNGGGSLRFGVGKEVRIVGGREMGLKGRVVAVLSGGELLVLRLSRSEEEVKVRVDDVAELGSLEEEKCLKRLKELKIQDNKDDVRGSSKKGRDSNSERKEHKRGRDDRVKVDDHKSNSSRKVSWLRSHIRVRIISKSFKGGRFYLKKGEVVDVVGPTTCDISMDDGSEIVQGVEQDILETALPRRGGPVLVLLGKHKGVFGSLVEKDTEREAGVVQDADSRELLKVRLEQIAEYVGDPSYIGY